MANKTASTLTVKYRGRVNPQLGKGGVLVRAGQPACQDSLALNKRSFPQLVQGGHDQALSLVATWCPDHPAPIPQPNTDQQDQTGGSPLVPEGYGGYELAGC